MRITAKRLRLAAAFVLAAAVIWAVTPYATNYVSSQAVVNAPLNTVLSPMQGQIIRRSPPAGTGIASGAPLVGVEIEERDRRYLEQLRARLALIDESLASIGAEVDELAALERVMSVRIASYRSRMIDRMAAERREAEAELAAAEARHENAEATLMRARALRRSGHATATRTDAEAAAHSSAMADVARARARLERISVETAAVEAGVFVQEGWNDVPYSQQRLDGIALQTVALTTERRRLEGERRGVAGQIAEEERMIAERETFIPVAASSGVVWKESGAVGETVVPGDVLIQTVDCDARFVEVTLAERHFTSIRPGGSAWVRLKGGSEAVLARITAVLGAGAKFDHPRLAAAVTEAKPDQLRVLVSLAETGLDGEPGAFCNVGRTAEVRFERRDIDQLRHVLFTAVREVRALFVGTAQTLQPGDSPRGPLP